MKIQCLVFFEIERGPNRAAGHYTRSRKHAESSATYKFALFPSKFKKDHPVCEIFRQAGIQVLDQKMSLPEKIHYEFFEITIDVSDTKRFRINVESHIHPSFVHLQNESCTVGGYSCSESGLSAVDNENNTIVEKLIGYKADIPYTTCRRGHPRGGTFLHFAAETGNAALVKLLLKHGANPNAKMADFSTATALFISVERNDVEIVRLLLENSADANAAVIKNHAIITPLLDAVGHCRVEIVKLLVENGADLSAPSNYGKMPLHLAVEKGSTSMVKLLIEGGADLNFREFYNGKTPLHIAVEKGHLEIVEYLLLHGASLEVRSSSNEGMTPLLTAILHGRSEISALLLEKGALVNVPCHDSRSALYLAVQNRQRNILETLLKYGVDINNPSNKKAFQFSLSRREKEYQQLTLCLLKYGFNVQVEDAGDSDLLFGAVAQNLHQVVEKLLKFGAISNAKREGTYDTHTILHEAARFADENMVELLLDHGADISAEIVGSSQKRTPLLEAIKYSNVQAAKALVANGADVKNPATLLHGAVERNCPEIVQLLLENGADVSFRNTNGLTPLSAAFTTENNSEVIDVLIKFGGDGCFRGFDPLSYYIDSNCFQVSLDHSFAEFDPSHAIFDRKLFKTYLECDEEDGAEKLARHRIKTEAVYESRGPKLPFNLLTKFKPSEFKNDCKREVENMKLEIIPHTNISFYDILTKKTHQISSYARDENTARALEEYNLHERFPIYWGVLKCRIQKGTWRRHILNLGNKLFKRLFSSFSGLPDEIKERIVNYLSNQDVLILEQVLGKKS